MKDCKFGIQTFKRPFYLVGSMILRVWITYANGSHMPMRMALISRWLN